jgi:cyclopropane fatty-acyl-phospholipid synthase-like methyltransferase
LNPAQQEVGFFIPSEIFMSDWTEGYVTDVTYLHGYYRELSPTLLAYAALCKRVSIQAEQPLRYLELGFGQGVAFNIHAAASTGEFWGTDFNPAQAAHAKELALASGSGARVFDLSFAELAELEELPEFDIIVLHGIWSWISEENRHVIIELARRSLKAGGMFYVSYNCTPGHSITIPLRHLMTMHVEMAAEKSKNISDRIDDAITFAQQVADAGAAFFQTHPHALDKLQKIAKQNRHYLAHEYFNRDWMPMPFSQVAERLTAAKLEYAASVHLLDNADVLNFTEPARKLLNALGHSPLRETVRDYLLNTQFRWDIFVKGKRSMSPFEQAERMKDIGFVLTTIAKAIPSTMTCPAGEAKLDEAIYPPLIAALEENAYAPKTLRELMAHSNCRGMRQEAVQTALMILVGMEHAHPVQDADTVAAVRSRCDALNKHLLERAQYAEEAYHLASPVTGGGAKVTRFQQLFLLARTQGKQAPAEWAEFAWQILSRQNQRVLKDGKMCESPEENLAELNAQACEFADTRLPILKALLVA